MLDVWHLHRVNWLRELPAEAAARLRAACVALEFQRGDPIFSPDPHPAHVYLLERGLVRIFRIAASGDEVTFGFVREGEVFGELTAFSDKPRESFAQATRRSVVWKIPREAFSEVLRASPEVFFEVSKQMGGRFKRIESRVEDLVFRPTLSRLAHVLLQLADDFGCEDDDGSVLVDLPLTQSDIAMLVGATRQTVNSALGQLVGEGLVARRNRRLTLRDRKRLREIADEEPTEG